MMQCNGISQDPALVVEEGAEYPRCRKGGIWQAPNIWPRCVEPPRCDPTIGQ